MKQLIWIFLFLSAAAATAAPQQLRIGTVTVHAHEAWFGEKSNLLRYATRTLNTVTHESVVRSFLLFKEGDVFNEAVLRETERNLRKLNFLNSASVTAGEPHDGVVDITVETEDAWAVTPKTSGAHMGGTGSFGLGLEDHNVAGSGAAVQIGFNHGPLRSSTLFDFDDPGFFGGYRRAHLTLSRNSDGFERRISLERPFYSFSAPYASQFSYSDVQRVDRWFANGRSASRFAARYREAIAAFDVAVNPNENTANRWTGGIHIVEDTFGNSAGSTAVLLPGDRSYRYLFVRFAHADNHFIVRKWADDGALNEDFDLGRHFSIEAAVSPRFLGTRRTTEFAQVTAGDGVELGERTFAIATASVQSRFDRGVQNGIASFEGRLIHQFDTREPQTLIARLAVHDSRNLDGDVQFFADAANGLRGYHLFALAGAKSALFNVEERMFPFATAHPLAPGFALFADAGSAADAALFAARHFRSDLGAGLRIQLPTGNILHFDVAYPMQPDLLGRRRVLLSVSTSHPF